MAKFDMSFEGKNLVPKVPYLVKVALVATITHFLILPLIFESFTFFGELRSFWQTILGVVITVYLSDLIKLKINGREWF